MSGGPIAKRELVEDSLRKILASPYFDSAPKLQSILEYVVKEELAGRGENLKAYSIGLDVLDKPDTFDPHNDPIVRVNFGRLRTALSLYYSNEGADDPVQIVLNKGTYRPEIQHRRGVAVSNDQDEQVNEKPFSGAIPKLIALASAAILVAVFGWYLLAGNLSESPDNRATAIGKGPPVIEVPAFKQLADSPNPFLIDGLRQQLVSDMSRFRTVRVRDSSGISNVQNTVTNPVPPASYRLEGIETLVSGERKLVMNFSDAKTSNVIWSSTIDLPTNDAEFYGILETSVRSIARQIAEVSGIVQMESLRLLKDREQQLGNQNTSNYECVLIYYHFDLTKSPTSREQARQCLKEKVDADTLDSSVWAAWSFLLFLDWTKNQERDLMNQAMEAARKAIRLDPANALGHEYLGSILLADGQHDRALEAYERALELNPSKSDLQILIGWEQALEGDWETGIDHIRQGLLMSPAPSGWMYIPLSINAFRKDDFATAVAEAETILQAGDKRGLILALAASIGLEDKERIAKYKAEFLEHSGNEWEDPMREIRNVFNDPEVLKKYDRILQPLINS